MNSVCTTCGKLVKQCERHTFDDCIRHHVRTRSIVLDGMRVPAKQVIAALRSSPSSEGEGQG